VRESVQVKLYEHEGELYVLARLLRIGAARKEAGRAFGFVKIRIPLAQEPVNRETFSFRVAKASYTEHSSAMDITYCAVI
jgi:hypothetical protein